MNQLSICLNGQEYPLAATLRVAYNVQGQHNHKAYSEIFNQIDVMTLEQQIDIVYAAYECAHSSDAPKAFNRKQFLDAFLDQYTLSDLMLYLKQIIAGITGKDLDDVESGDSAKASEGN